MGEVLVMNCLRCQNDRGFRRPFRRGSHHSGAVAS